MREIYKEINNDYYAVVSKTVCTLYSPSGEFVGFIDRRTAEYVNEMHDEMNNYTFKIWIKERR